MSKENKPVKAAKPKKAKKAGGGIGKFFLAFAMAIAVFIALLVLQTGITNKYEKKAVVVAKTDIAANVDITEANIGQFFTTVDYDVTKLPSGYIEGSAMNETLANVLTLTDIPKGQVITNKVYISTDSVTGELARLSESNLVETSFSTDSIADAVAGTLRRGDVVNIYLYYSEETDGKELMNADIEKVVLEDIHIKQAYDGGGAIVTDEAAAATMFDIVASEEDVDALNELLVRKMRGGFLKMTIVKVNDVAF